MTKAKRTAKYVAKDDSIHILSPKNDNQRLYLQALKTSIQTIVMGCAGTGKTYMASVYAAQQYQKNQIDKIILTRPNVPSGRSLGFFAGSMEEKMAPWVVPFTDVIREVLGAEVYEIAVKKKNIDVVPFEVMRGRTFRNAFVILDEAQNTDPKEMKMFLTRIGEGSQVVINGDIKQSDLKSSSGLNVLLGLVKSQDLPVPVIEFTADDIVRSDICAMWIKAFDKEGL
jgi:phosphate starvation-inducible PhoH-like protein